MTQPYSKLQETFKTASAVPKIPAPQDPNLTFETQMLCSQPVLYVNHKQLVQKVCIYVVGDDLGNVGFDFEDLRIRKEMMGVKTEFFQMDTKASNGDFDFRAIPHNSKCRYGERGAADAKPKAQIILCVLSSILATQMPCRTPSRSEALRSATDALRRLLARRSAGAVLKPSGGNCAVLP